MTPASTLHARAIPHLVETLLAQQSIAGLRSIDRHGETVSW